MNGKGAKGNFSGEFFSILSRAPGEVNISTRSDIRSTKSINKTNCIAYSLSLRLTAKNAFM